jgi:hypothetical protein
MTTGALDPLSLHFEMPEALTNCAPSTPEEASALDTKNRYAEDLMQVLAKRLEKIGIPAHGGRFTIAINPEKAPKDRSRWIGVYSDFLRCGNPALCDFIIQSSFLNPYAPGNYGRHEGYKVDASGNAAGNGQICEVHTFPSRVTPERLKAIAASYNPEIRKKLGLRTPVIAVIVSNLRNEVFCHEWDSANLIKNLGRVVRGKRAKVLLVTDGKTDADDLKTIRETLGNRLVPDDWTKGFHEDVSLSTGAMALADHVIVSGDSLPFMSDAVASKKSFRLLHGFQAFNSLLRKESPWKDCAQVLVGKIPGLGGRSPNKRPTKGLLTRLKLASATPEGRCVENFRRSGAKGPYSSIHSVSPIFDTGWTSFARKMAAAIATKIESLARTNKAGPSSERPKTLAV